MQIDVDPAVQLGSRPLDIASVRFVARRGTRVGVTEDAFAKVASGRAVIDALASDAVPHYGVSTGFGALATTSIPPEKRRALQVSLIRSHAAGAGPEVETEVVRATQLLRLQTLATGRTGVRPEVVRLYADMLNAGITPIVHENGSLGCSGDLAPLAHIALAATGEGEVTVDGRRLPATEALAAAGLAPVELVEKEGLALINGTDGMLGMLCLAIHDLAVLIATADAAAAMSVEALLGTDRVFADDLQALRPHPGQRYSAEVIRRMLAGSPIVASHAGSGDGRVQDAYSLRCAPQVHGAARDTLDHSLRVARVELGSAIDNPVVLPDGRVESNGNFHGAPIGYVLDFLAIAAADVASMSERRTDRMLDPARSNGLPPFLADDPGVDSGLMIAQYTAASVVSDMKRLAVPASVDSIPTSAMQEDHVSMGWSAARKLRRSIHGLRQVLAIEMLAAVRALDYREPLASSAPIGRLRELLHPATRGAGPDRFLAPEIAAVTAILEEEQHMGILELVMEENA